MDWLFRLKQPPKPRFPSKQSGSRLQLIRERNSIRILGSAANAEGGPRPNCGRPTKEQAAAKAKGSWKRSRAARRSTEGLSAGRIGLPSLEQVGAAASGASCFEGSAPISAGEFGQPASRVQNSLLSAWSHVHSDGKVYMYPEGEPLEFVEGLFEPFEATPPFSATPRKPRREPEPALEAIEPEPEPFEAPEPVPPSNVSRCGATIASSPVRALTTMLADDPAHRILSGSSRRTGSPETTLLSYQF